MSSNSKIVITHNRQMGYTCCGPENWRRMESSNLFSLTSMINDFFSVGAMAGAGAGAPRQFYCPLPSFVTTLKKSGAQI